MKKKSVVVVAILALAALAWFGWRWREKKQQGPAFREVVVERGDLEITVLATGIVEPENRLELKPPIAGRVESILVEEGQMVHRGQVLAWLSSSERAALLDAARAKGEAELAHWEELFRPTPLLAPLSGLIIVKNVVPGQVVTAADSVLVMSDHLIVNTQVDETDIGQVKVSQPAAITLDAYPREEIPGTVNRVAFESKTVNNVTIYEVLVLPGKVPDFMRSGMTANVKFLVDRREAALILPAEAIRQEGGSTVVTVVERPGSGMGKAQEIQVGVSDGKRIEIMGGIEEGATVLVPVASKPVAAGSSRPASPFSPFQRRPGGRR